MTRITGKLLFTIRGKLLSVCLILLILPIAAVGLFSFNVAKQETNELIESNLRNNVHFAEEVMASLEESVQKGVMTAEEAQEKFRIILLGEKSADNTRPINKHIDLGPNGYLFAMDEQGNVLAHPSLEGQNIWKNETSDGQPYIQEMIGKAQAGGGFEFYEFPLPGTNREAEKISYAEISPTWGWVIVAGAYMQDFNSGQTHILQVILITLAVCIVLGLIILTLFARHLTRPIKALTLQAERIAQGDLTGEVPTVRGRDEVSRLASSFGQLTANLRELTGNQYLGANALAGSSHTLSELLKETTQAVHQSAAAVSEVAYNNETQARSIQETSRAMEEMAEGIQRVAATSSEAFEASTGTLGEAEKGDILIRRSTGLMGYVSETVGELSTIVGRLGSQSTQIGEIVEAMREISEQTNLLALNASIEAARAGEQGRGFAVVAGEVRKLAERSHESAAQVAELIDSIRSEIDTAQSSMSKGEREVEEGVAAIRETGESFARILQATRAVVDQVQEASVASEEMSASAQQISASLQEMERGADSTAGAAQSVAAASEEQLASLDEIAASANKLSGMADSMRLSVQRFKM